MINGGGAEGTGMRQAVRAFIVTSFLFREACDGIGDSESLLAAGLIDSTGILELISFLETEFGIAVADEEIVPENLDSIEQIVTYVERKRGGCDFSAVAV